MDETRFTVRPFAADDLTAADAVLCGAWSEIDADMHGLLGSELHRYFFGGFIAQCGREMASSLSAAAKTDTAFTVTDADGSIAAMGSWTPAGEIGRVGRFAVRPDLRGRGIGTALVRAVTDSMRTHGMRYAQLDIGGDAAYAAASRTLEKAGFGHPVPHVTYYRKNIAPTDFVLPDGVELRRTDAEECRIFAGISVEAWQPIWASYRRMLGDELFRTMGDVDQNKYNSALKMLSDPAIFGYGLFCGGVPAGFCGWRVSDVPGGKSGVVSLNGIADAFKGRRLGLLMQNFITGDMLAHGITYAKVLTGGDEGHAPARRTYENAGFTRALKSITLRAVL